MKARQIELFDAALSCRDAALEAFGTRAFRRDGDHLGGNIERRRRHLLSQTNRVASVTAADFDQKLPAKVAELSVQISVRDIESAEVIEIAGRLSGDAIVKRLLDSVALVERRWNVRLFRNHLNMRIGHSPAYSTSQV